ncbi:ATPase subunit 9, mitochondrial [Tanacetum coccineum]
MFQDFRYSDTTHLSRSVKVLKLKNFKKDATLKLFKNGVIQAIKEPAQATEDDEDYRPQLEPSKITLGWCSVYRLYSLYKASDYKIKKNALHGKKTCEENYQLEMLEGAKLIGAGAATIASAGAAIGIGNVLSSSIHSVARNPLLAKQSFCYAILGFALTEAIASFVPMIAFLISSVFLSKNQRKKGLVS